MKYTATLLRSLPLILVVSLFAVGCGQKGPLIVEPTEPLPVEPLQKESTKTEVE